LAQGLEATQLLDAFSKPRALDLGLLFVVLTTALDAMFSLVQPTPAGFQFVGHHGSALPQRFADAEEGFGSHEPGTDVEDDSLEALKALVLGLGRQDHVLALLKRRRRRG
jgi:hypothetical protein